MKDEEDEAGRFPLGKPTNRTEASDLTPIEGRPNWFRNRRGEEVYVEPPKPPKVAPWIPEYWRKLGIGKWS
jgi:hypothetical protein